MREIKPSYEIMTPLDGDAILKHIERCGRVCYKSEDKIKDGSAEKFVAAIVRNGHESVLEHFSITVRFIVDRGVSHEIVRHRLASYSQCSTRYVRYEEDVPFIRPSGLETIEDVEAWRDACLDAEESYQALLAAGKKPEVARAVLPTCLKTELIMTANLREWRHFFKLRTSERAHPDIRSIALAVLRGMAAQIPVVLDDILMEVES